MIDELEWLGILRRTGEWRKGRPVHVTTEFGSKLREEKPGDEEFDAAIEALIRRKLAH